MQPTDSNQLQSLVTAFLIIFGINFLFCRSLVATLSLINEKNRTIKPSIVWLFLLPGFNNLIIFFIVFGISKSIQNELESRNFELNEKPAFFPGLIYAVLFLAVIVIIALEVAGIKLPDSFTPLFAVMGFSQIFFFVQYWMKINWYKNVLENDEKPVER